MSNEDNKQDGDYYKYKTYYMFEETKYYFLSELVAQFVEDKANWERGRNFFFNGSIYSWVASNSDMDESTINQIKKNFPNKTLCFFIFIYTFNSNLDFYLFGKKIDLKSLEFYINNYNIKATNDEKTIVDMFFRGELIKFSSLYDNLTKRKSKLTRFLIQMNSYYKHRNNQEEILCYLQYLNKTKLYIFPINGEMISISNLHEYLSVDEISKLKKKFTFPETFIRIIEGLSPKAHKRIVAKLREVDRYILPSDFKEQTRNSFVKTILSTKDFMPKKEWREILKNYHLPKYLIDEINSSPLERYIQAVETLKNLQKKYYLISKEKYPISNCVFGKYQKIDITQSLSEMVNFDTMTLDRYRELNSIIKEINSKKSTLKQKIATKIKKRFEIGELSYLFYFITFTMIVMFFIIMAR